MFRLDYPGFSVWYDCEIYFLCQWIVMLIPFLAFAPIFILWAHCSWSGMLLLIKAGFKGERGQICCSSTLKESLFWEFVFLVKCRWTQKPHSHINYLHAGAAGKTMQKMSIYKVDGHLEQSLLWKCIKSTVNPASSSLSPSLISAD